MSAYHPSNATRAARSSFALAGQHALGAAPLTRMARVNAGADVTRVWACDPTGAKSLRPRRDTKWEVDSEAEVNGS